MNDMYRYGCLSLGVADLYLRFPPLRPDGSLYREKVWDHAAGLLVVEEAGGKCTDCTGSRLRFGGESNEHDDNSGSSYHDGGLRLLSGDVLGIVACRPEMHTVLLQAIKDARLET